MKNILKPIRIATITMLAYIPFYYLIVRLFTYGLKKTATPLDVFMEYLAYVSVFTCAILFVMSIVSIVQFRNKGIWWNLASLVLNGLFVFHFMKYN